MDVWADLMTEFSRCARVFNERGFGLLEHATSHYLPKIPPMPVFPTDGVYLGMGHVGGQYHGWLQTFHTMEMPNSRSVEGHFEGDTT